MSERERPGPGLTRRRFIGSSGGALLAIGGLGSFVAACGGSGKERKEVVVVTWGDPKLAQPLHAEFKKRTGITIRSVPGENSADFYNKISLGGRGQYDVVISNVGYVPKYVKAGLIERIDRSQLANAGQIYDQFWTDPRWKQWYLTDDPNQVWSVPHQWGVYSMTYRHDLVHPDRPISWNQLWNVPRGKVASDNTPVQLLAIAGRLNGVPWDSVLSMGKSELKDAVDRLRRLRPIALPSSADLKINAFRTKAAYIGQTFSLGFADLVNKQAGKSLTTSVIPTEGTFGALDGSMLLKGAPNPENALEYINFEAGKESQDIYWSFYKSPTANRETTETVIANGSDDARMIKAQGGNKPGVAAAMIQQQEPADPDAWSRAWDQVIA